MNDGDAPAARCPNCDEPLAGRYCWRCGQDQHADRTVRALVADFLEGALDLDSRLWRTLRLLLTRPGFLSAEHRAGRRVRYLPPVRLYLISSVLFFSMIALAPAGVVRVGVTPLATEAAGDATSAEVPATWLDARFERAGRDPERLEDMFFASFAWVMFVLIPVFALLLRLVYAGSGLLYVQHLVFALHYHAFAFLTQAVGYGAMHAGGALGIAAFLTPHAANAVYLCLGARRFYGEGWWPILGKVAVVGFAYLLAVAAGMVATLFVLVLLFVG